MKNEENYTLLSDTSETSIEVAAAIDQPRYRPNFRYATLCSACCAITIVLAGSWFLRDALSNHFANEILDPFDQPGYIRFNASDPLSSNWIPYDPSISPAIDWMSRIRTAMNLPLPVIDLKYGLKMKDRIRTDSERWHTDVYPNAEQDPETRERLRKDSLAELGHLQDKTILLLGDSLDRNTVWFLAQNLASEASLFHPQYLNASDVEFRKHRDWDVGAIPHQLKLRGELNMDITNCFLYGHDETNFFKFQAEFHGPSKAETRITQLCKPYTDQLDYPISMIQFQSGMWDLALFGRQDALHDEDRVEEPLEQDRLNWWRNRTVSTIRSIKEAWPGVPIVYRTIHRPATGANYRDFVWDTSKGKQKNLFTDVRATQLRQLQLAVAKEEGLRIFDWGQVFEGYQKYAYWVHPTDYPGGVIMSNALLHYAWLVQQ